MNQDGKNELIITVSSEGYFKYGRDVVLREFEDGKVCIYWFDVETEVSDTGYICYLDHNWNYSFYKPIFNGYEVVYEKVAWYDMDFFIEGNKVTREEYEEYLKPHDFHKLSYKDWVHLVYYIEKQ